MTSGRSLAALMLATTAVLSSALAAHAGVEIRSDERGKIHFLSWDNESPEMPAGDMAQRNLLRPPKAIVVEMADGDAWKPAEDSAQLITQKTADGGFDVTIAGPSDIDSKRGKVNLRLAIPFNPRMSAVTVLPARIDERERLHLPAIVSAPGFGDMLVTTTPGLELHSRLEGSRRDQLIDWIIDAPPLGAGEKLTLRFRPWKLPAPAGVTDRKRWNLARQGWLNPLQVTARWGEQRSVNSAPSGVLGNNVLSDPVSSCLYIYADHAFWTPELAPGISSMSLVRRTLDWWLDKRLFPTGEMPGYLHFKDFLDTNPSILIAAWDYAEATGDRAWLQKRIAVLQRVADFQASRDIDSDGLVEAVRSGNAGTLTPDQRSCSALDAVNCGHKDAYSNILTYRAFRCMADLERKLGRADEQQRYQVLADKLKQSFAKIMVNPKTGNVVGWISRDGEVHDYLSLMVNGLAIEYGLIEGEPAKRILKLFRSKLTEAGFTRYDLGLPMNLIPIRRLDYILSDSNGAPQRDDGRDTFGQYLNGGVCTSDAMRFMSAHYVAGEREFADSLLDRMLARVPKGDYTDGGFPTSIVDRYPDGAEFVDWQGNPCGYEGLLTHCHHFVGAVCVREPALRARFYRPLSGR